MKSSKNLSFVDMRVSSENILLGSLGFYQKQLLIVFNLESIPHQTKPPFQSLIHHGLRASYGTLLAKPLAIEYLA